jgi:uncharacterized protein YjiS (DUF1127 family)
MTTTSGNGSAGIVVGLARWWRSLRGARSRLGELHGCGSEAANIARDIGLSRADLYTIAAKRPDAADQLKRRLAALDIDEAALLHDDPRVARDLERVCSLCGQKRQCERDLARDPGDPIWRTYCPNTLTLDAVKEEAAAAAEQTAPN